MLMVMVATQRDDGGLVAEIYDTPDGWEPPATWHRSGSGMIPGLLDPAQVFGAASHIGAHLEIQGDVIL